VTEPTSHVEQEIQRRIQAQRVKVQAARERRASLAEARRYGIARRHAAKLRHLADAEERRLEAEDDDGAASDTNVSVDESRTVLSLDGRERPATRPAPEPDEDDGQGSVAQTDMQIPGVDLDHDDAQSLDQPEPGLHMLQDS
jgi:hypothetical protein